ncbi:CoA-binding protein [Pseudalkalibacillus salsuginis]|uniref:CoA-binding protein n=1 Tax=Pseudalkalibacillus salsuginis TaxID=2910972 RepID=UPI001F15F62D|nr:CoA-binding protein [Pseudalkalibacillus salsuginis]MCF6408167.1 CoA-binding protein [Pseudalkalibacillus salsuginis]
MSFQNPDQAAINEILKTKKRIAVVGLSNKPHRTSYQVSKYMQGNGYEIIPVNPTIDEAMGLKAYPSLKDVEGPIDIVNVFRRSEELPAVAEEVKGIDTDVFWAQLGLLNEEVVEILKGKDTTIIMDRCIKVEHATM